MKKYGVIYELVSDYSGGNLAKLVAAKIITAVNAEPPESARWRPQYVIAAKGVNKKTLRKIAKEISNGV